jgi:protein tyrosine phosphatase (PTP) superfamily phosphohydrolase (DUF442 family)
MLNRFRSDEDRSARRLARIARWDRPLGGRLASARAWLNMLFVDHGIFRVLYLNLHRISPRMWRAAQPAPYQLQALAKAGIRTVINLRGGRDHGSWPLEKQACEQAGLTLVDFTAFSRAAPPREMLLVAPAFFAGIAYPAVMHCKSGADRAGFAAALYLLVHEQAPLDEAIRQLHWRYGHFRWSKTGILDAFFEAYRREGLEKGLPFLRWVEEVYDPERLMREFRTGFWSSLLVDRVLRRE